MKKIRILHTADLHLGSPFSSFERQAEILSYELLHTFCSVIDTARRYAVDAVLICGDITDNGVLSSDEYKTVVNKFNEISDIPVFIIFGNHDIGFKADFPENVHIFCGFEKYSLENADIYGSDYSENADVCEQFVPDNPDKINIVMQHGTLGGAKDNPVPTDVYADYVALGHYHSYTVRKNCVYSGVPMGRGFDEQGQKGVVVADISKETVNLEFVPTAKRIFSELETDISDCGTYMEILDKIYAAAPSDGDLYRFVLTGQKMCDIPVSKINAVLAQQYFYACVIDKTAPKIDLDSLAAEDSLRGYFVRNALKCGGDEDVIKYGLTALKGERIYINED